MLAHTVMATADIWYLAKLGQTELAGAGIAMTGTFTVLCFGIGFLGAVRILIAQAEGAGTLDAHANLPWIAICCAVICGLGAFCLAPQAETVMDWLATPGQVSAFGAEYFRIRMYGALGVFVSIACFGWFDGQGQTKIGMRIMVTANFINILLDPILIFGMGPISALGVEGAAWATVCAQWFQGLAALYLLVKHRPPVLVRPLPGFPDLRLIRSLVKIGGPLGIQMVMEVLGYAAFASMIAHFSELHLAVSNVMVRISSLAFLPCYGLSQGASILAGQALGRNDRNAVKATLRASIQLGGALMLFLGGIFICFDEFWVSLFRTEPKFIELGVALLAIVALTQIIDALVMGFVGVLNGLGDTRFTMYAGICTSWLIMIPFAWFLCHRLGLGAMGPWASTTIQVSVMSLLLWRRWRTLLKRPIWSVTAG